MLRPNMLRPNSDVILRKLLGSLPDGAYTKIVYTLFHAYARCENFLTVQTLVEKVTFILGNS